MRTAKKVSEIKRAAPDMRGVPGELVQADEGLGLEFGYRKASPYDLLLDQLTAKKPGEAWLKFGNTRARASVYARACKKHLRVSFAEKDGMLYAQFEGRMVEDLPKLRRERILEALKGGLLNHFKIAAKLREGGDSTVDGPTVEAILAQMSRDGSVVKRGADWALKS
jgi:hypothetical protein